MFIAADESSSADHVLIGSVWFPLEQLANFEKKVTELRIKEKYWREVHLKKLKKVGGREDEFYRKFLKIAFAIPSIRFSFIIVKKDTKYDQFFHDGNIMKRNLVFLYFLLSRRYKWWKVEETPYIVFDEMSTPSEEDGTEPAGQTTPPAMRTEDIPETRKHIEKYINKKVVCFSPCKSHISSAVQLIDVMTGLVALRCRIDIEGKPIVGIKKVKLNLLGYVEENFGINLSHGTAPWTAPINIWRHVPRFQNLA